MTDLARLGIVIDTTQVKDARQALEKLAKVGGETETRVARAASALKTLGDNAAVAHKEVGELSSASKEAAKAIEGAANAQEKADKASKKASEGVKDFKSGLLDVTKGVVSGKSVVEAFTDTLSDLGPEGMAAAAAVQAVSFAFEQASNAMKWADDLQSKADRIGVTAEYIQKISFAATASGVKVDAMETALGTLSDTLDDFKANAGSPEASEAFKALGFTPEQIEGFNSTSELLPILADRVSQLGSRAEQLRITKKLGIEELLPMLKRGASGLDDMAGGAQNLSSIMDDETVHSLAEFNRQTEISSSRIDLALKKSFAELAPTIAYCTEKLADMLTILSQKVPGGGTVGGVMFKIGVASVNPAAAVSVVAGDITGKSIAKFNDDQKYLNQARGLGLSGKAAVDYAADQEKIDHGPNSGGWNHGGMGKTPAIVVKTPEQPQFEAWQAALHGGGGGGGGSQAANSATEAARRVIDAQSQQIATFGMSSRELERWNAQQAAAAAPTKALREEILAQDAALQKLENTADASKAHDDAASEIAKRLADEAERRDRFVSQSLNSQTNEIALAQASLVLSSATTRQREDELDILRLKQDMLAAGVAADSAEGQQLLSNERAYQRITAQAQRQTAYHDEIRKTEQDAFHSVTDLIKAGDTAWDDWKKAGISALQAIIAKALELKVLNPLENKLFGTNLPTGSDGSGSLFNDFANSVGNWLGGGESSSQGATTMDSAMASTTQLANGTNFHRGGPAIINDGGGPEVVQLPRGSRVFTAMQSREMVQQAKPSPEIDLNAAAAVLAKVLAGHMAKVGNDAKGHADRNLNSYDRNLNRRMPALQRMGT